MTKNHLQESADYKLLASAPDKAGIIKMIAKYWYNTPENIDVIPAWNNLFIIWQNKTLMGEFRVILKGKRYRFEGRVKP